MAPFLRVGGPVVRLYFGIVAPDDDVGIIFLGHVAPPCMSLSAD